MPETRRTSSLVRLAAIAAAAMLLAAACANNEAPPNVPIRSAGEVLTTVPDSLFDAGRSPSIAINPDGHVAVSYLLFQPELKEGEIAPPVLPGDPQPPAVVLAVEEEGVWTRTSITKQETAPKAIGVAEGIATEEGAAGPVVHTSLAIDGQGDQHVAWSTPGGLFYASDRTFESPEKVVSGTTSGASIAVASDGAPWISFFRGGTVEAARRQGNGWTTEQVASAGGEGGSQASTTSIGVGGDAEPVVAFGDGGTTAVARRSGGSWSRESVPGPGGLAVSLAVDGDGNPHLAYYDRDGNVRHAHSIGGGPWDVSELGTARSTEGADERWGTGIALDEEGTHYVAWADPGRNEILHATNAGGEWASEPVPNSLGGATPDIAAAPDGKGFAIAWYDAENGDLQVAVPVEEGVTVAFSPKPAGSPPGGTAGGEPPAPPAECKPGGTEVTVAAENLAFDEECLAAPADQAFTLAFDNKDPAPHNVAIYTDSNATETLFQGETFTGPATQDYKVEPLKKGTYFFRCDVHPVQMVGTFVVG